MTWTCPNCGAANEDTGFCVSEGCTVAYADTVYKENGDDLKNAKDKIIAAAIALCDHIETVEMMRELKGTESLDAPVEFMELFEAVNELKKVNEHDLY